MWFINFEINVTVFSNFMNYNKNNTLFISRGNYKGFLLSTYFKCSDQIFGFEVTLYLKTPQPQNSYSLSSILFWNTLYIFIVLLSIRRCKEQHPSFKIFLPPSESRSQHFGSDIPLHSKTLYYKLFNFWWDFIGGF